MITEWYQTADLCTSVTINNVLQSQVGKLLEAIREAGFDVEINVSKPPEAKTETPR